MEDDKDKPVEVATGFAPIVTFGGGPAEIRTRDLHLVKVTFVRREICAPPS